MAGKRPPTPLEPEALARLADAVVAAVRDSGFVARAKLGGLGIAPAHREAVLAEVGRRGLEVDRRGARAPLRDQLAARVAAGAVPLDQVKRAIAGASAKEPSAVRRRRGASRRPSPTRSASARPSACRASSSPS